MMGAALTGCISAPVPTSTTLPTNAQPAPAAIESEPATDERVDALEPDESDDPEDEEDDPVEEEFEGATEGDDDESATDPTDPDRALAELEAELKAEGLVNGEDASFGDPDDPDDPGPDDPGDTSGADAEGDPEEPAAAAPEEPKQPQKPKKHERVWVTHTIIPGESKPSIADRYGVSEKSLIRWNKSSLGADGKKMLRAGRTLKVFALDPPPPRVEITAKIRKGDSWSKVARRYRVDEAMLRKWNRKRKMIAGKTLRVWVEPKRDDADDDDAEDVTGDDDTPAVAGESSERALARKLARIKVRTSGASVGKPNKGYLINGVAVPTKSGILACRRPEYCYGSSHTIKQLMVAAVKFKHRTGYEKPVVIGAVSKRKGGRFRPHRSHQSGRDIDIRLPVRASVTGTEPRSTSDIDWDLSWKLVHAFLESGEVQYIFLSYPLQRRLYKAARAAGASKEDLARWIQWPRASKTNNGVVRHAKGHDRHIHVRVTCGARDRKCGGR